MNDIDDNSNACLLQRCLPDPIPAIHPLPEYLAEGARREIYNDTKAILQVPWMGVVTMAFAHYPNFYSTLWKGLRPLYTSREFSQACRKLRSFAEQSVRSLSPPQLELRLSEQGYAPRELSQIFEMLEIFSHGNMPYLLIATQARLLLEGHGLSNSLQVEISGEQYGPQSSVPFILMEAHHVDAPSRDIYDDVKTTLGLPFVNTDYRALTRWPTYFTLAWNDLKGHISTSLYKSIVDDIHEEAVKLAEELPNPTGLSVETLQHAAQSEASLDELIEMVRLFQWLLPGLVANIAFFRNQFFSTGVDRG